MKVGRVRCYGPCQRWFRPGWVQMDRSVALFLNSPQARHEPGLLWLCPDCRPEPPPAGPETFLPVEIWLMVFRKLERGDLLRVRLTSRRWKEMVDGDAELRKEFCVSFPEGITVNHRYKPKNVIPVASQVIFNDSKITSVGDWWGPVGRGLTLLCLYKCKVYLRTLVEMLKETPNLTKLKMYGTKFIFVEDEFVADFRLEKLKVLSCHFVVDVFSQIFPLLEEVNVTSEFYEDFNEDATCRLLQSVQGTLKKLSCRFTPLVLDQIAHLNLLQLTTVRHSGVSESAVHLSRIEPSIEDLTVRAYKQDLCEIGQNLPYLKQLEVCVQGGLPCVPTFLAEMPQLSKLALSTEGNQQLNIQNFRNPNLTSLNLKSLVINGPGLQNYLENCPKLQEIEIVDCSTQTWSDLFSIPFHQKPLRRLLLWHFRTKQPHPTQIPPIQRSLTELELWDTDIPTDLLIQFLLQCPLLRSLTMTCVKTVTNDVIPHLTHLRNLQKLTISSCDALTDECAPLVEQNCAHVRTVIIYGCKQITDEGYERLREFSRSLQFGRASNEAV